MESKQFVTLWQTAESLAIFCQRAKMTPQNACNKAKRLRDFGIPLKVFRHNLLRRGVDWKEIQELKALADSLSQLPRSEK